MRAHTPVAAPDRGAGRRIPIRTKLQQSFLVVIALICTVFLALAMQLIATRIFAEAQDKVAHDLNSAAEIYSWELRHISDVVRLTAERTLVRDTLASRPGTQLAEDGSFATEMHAVMLREGLDVLTLTDAKGRVLLRAGNVANSQGDVSSDQIVAAVLQSGLESHGTAITPASELLQESADLAARARFEILDTPMAWPRSEQYQTDGMMLEAAAPVHGTQGELLGVLYGGVLLNRDFDIVDRVKDTVYQNIQYQGRDIGTSTIFQNDLRISTNVLNTDGTRALGSRVSATVYNQVVVQGQRYIGRAFVVNDWYITAYQPIRSISDQVIGILYVGVLEKPYADIRRRTILAFVGITAGGAVASILLSWFVARRITEPLGELVTASRRLTEGDLDVRVRVRTSDEVQELADAFNTMAAALRKRDERLRDLAQSRVMKSERLAMIGQLAAGVAHELNNPMQGIVTYASLLLEDMPTDDPDRQSIETIVTQANRCSGIVRRLLDFSRARSSDRQPFELPRVLEGCLGLVEQQALFHNITVVRDYQPDLPLVFVDPDQLQQVFLNLIINAAEAMDGQGTLTLRTRHAAADSHVVVDVADTGHGIAPEDLDKVFVPFFTTKEAGHGVGLGLAISYNIVRALNGTLSVASHVGKGTTFTVTLPVARQDRSPSDGK